LREEKSAAMETSPRIRDLQLHSDPEREKTWQVPLAVDGIAALRLAPIALIEARLNTCRPAGVTSLDPPSFSCLDQVKSGVEIASHLGRVSDRAATPVLMNWEKMPNFIRGN
jgi:hypothetical protein